MTVDTLSIIGTACGAALGAGLAVIGGISKDLWTKRAKMKRDRALFIRSIRRLSQQISEFDFSDSDFYLTGLLPSGRWHIGRVRTMLNETSDYLLDAKAAIDFQEFKDVSAFWMAKKSISKALSYLEIQEGGLSEEIEGDQNELWEMLKTTISVIIHGVMEGLSHSIEQLSPDSTLEEGQGLLSPRSANFFKIVNMPAGEAPEWVRSAWVGTVLPKASVAQTGEYTGGLSGKALEEMGYSPEYTVNAATAISVLNQTRPDAAKWWTAQAPHIVAEGRLLSFEGPCCLPIY
jgi:hypothetical protein